LQIDFRRSRRLVAYACLMPYATKSVASCHTASKILANNALRTSCVRSKRSTFALLRLSKKVQALLQRRLSLQSISTSETTAYDASDSRRILISCAHPSPEGGLSTSCVSCGSIQAGSGCGLARVYSGSPSTCRRTRRRRRSPIFSRTSVACCKRTCRPALHRRAERMLPRGSWLEQARRSAQKRHCPERGEVGRRHARGEDDGRGTEAG
jgi:hypothetical protein